MLPWDVAGFFLQDFLPRLLEALKGASAETEACQDVCLSRSMHLNKLSCLFFESSIATLLQDEKKKRLSQYMEFFHCFLEKIDDKKSNFRTFLWLNFLLQPNYPNSYTAPGGFDGPKFWGSGEGILEVKISELVVWWWETPVSRDPGW